MNHQIEDLQEEIKQDIAAVEDNKEENKEMWSKIHSCRDSSIKCMKLCDDLRASGLEIQDEINATLAEIEKHDPTNFDETYKILWSNIDIKLKIKDLVAKLTALQKRLNDI